MNDDSVIRKRFSELSHRAFVRERREYTDFLSMHELTVLESMKRVFDTPFAAFGGTDGCERRIACFDAQSDFISSDYPISCVIAKPKSTKFSDALTHRDYLGALMGLGIERKLLGDIVLRENSAYIFCVDSISQLIIDELTDVKHTSITCALTNDAISGTLYTLKEESLRISSERADLVIAKVYDFSRETSAELFRAEKVFIDSATCFDGSRTLNSGETVSVRGYGRFIYMGFSGTSKKGKLCAQISKYI